MGFSSQSSFSKEKFVYFFVLGLFLLVLVGFGKRSDNVLHGSLQDPDEDAVFEGDSKVARDKSFYELNVEPINKKHIKAGTPTKSPTPYPTFSKDVYDAASSPYKVLPLFSKFTGSPGKRCDLDGCIKPSDKSECYKWAKELNLKNTWCEKMGRFCTVHAPCFCKCDVKNIMDVALFVGKGVSSNGKKAFSKVLSRPGKGVRAHPFDEFDAGDGYLSAGKSVFQALVVPGGTGGAIKSGLKRHQALDSFLDFVRDGAGYLGTCAGAYFARSNFIGIGSYLKEVPSPPCKMHYRCKRQGATRGRGWGHTDLYFTEFGKTIVSKKLRQQEPINIVYGGGPVMETTCVDWEISGQAPEGCHSKMHGNVTKQGFELDNIRILMRHKGSVPKEIAKPKHGPGVPVGDKYSGDDAAAVSVIELHGGGKVAIVGPHPELNPDTHLDALDGSVQELLLVELIKYVAKDRKL